MDARMMAEWLLTGGAVCRRWRNMLRRLYVEEGRREDYNVMVRKVQQRILILNLQRREPLVDTVIFMLEELERVSGRDFWKDGHIGKLVINAAGFELFEMRKSTNCVTGKQGHEAACANKQQGMEQWN